MNKLWIRLSIAFGVVSLVGVVLAVVLINRQVDVQFRHYVARSQQILPSLTPALTPILSPKRKLAGH